MNVLLIGSGGREHALAWKIAASPMLTRLFAAPGNPGIAKEAECVALDAADHAAVLAFCREKAIDLVVVGPEAPLVAGFADALREGGVCVFGPSAAAARLEGSKGSPRIFAPATASRPPPMAVSATRKARKPMSRRLAPRSSSRPTG
jgi:phosphoribosylamine--glycine ligase